MKLLARSRLNNAIKTGRMTRGACVLLNGDCDGLIEAHHTDYSQPLLVYWVCHHHHRRLETGWVTLPKDAKPAEVGPKIDGRWKNRPPSRKCAPRESNPEPSD
jgi:hypothetical protein